MFALDIDSGITIDEVLNRCRCHHILPTFMYSTFSSNNNDKFRLVFQTEFEINDIRVRDLIQLALMTLFKEADRSCKDASRMFFGGKEIIYHDYGASIDIATLVFSVCEYFTVKDDKNYATNIKRFCQNVSVDLLNGLPYIELLADDGQNCKEKGEVLYKYNRRSHYSLQNDEIVNSEVVIIHFNQKTTKELASSMPLGKFARVSILEDKRERKVAEGVDFDKLSSVCKLYSDFTSGAYWAHHGDLFGMATNLLSIKGGKTRFLDCIASNENYYDFNKWKYIANYINKSSYYPMNCNNYCPYQDDCEHSKNMLETAKLVRGRVNVIEQLQTISLAEAEEKVAIAFQRAIDSKENKVFVIKAPTGIGKTKLYLNLKNTTVALPRHNLKTDVSARMNAKGNQHEVIPELPKGNERFLSELNSLYAKGHHEGATALKKEMAKHDKSMAQYFKELARIKNCEGTLLTTHERLLYTEDNNEQIIIDEDIVATMLKIDKVSINDLIAISSRTKLFSNIIKTVNDAEVGVVNSISLEMMFDFSLMAEERKELLKQLKGVSTNVVGFLSCTHWIKNNDGYISYITRRNLPQKKIIILSATANKYIYKLLFGDKVEFIDIGEVETIGKVIQYPQWSFSRYQMREVEKFIPISQAIAGQQPVITFKEFSKDFPNCIATFGNLTGIDTYGGKDMVIVGTSHVHPSAYLLYASVLGIDYDNNTSLHDLPIKRNGMEFYFYTFKNEGLREIQLYFIESEQIQAIGRARLLRKDCTVTLLSRLPSPGAKFMYLDKNEVNELTNEIPVALLNGQVEAWKS